MTARAYEVLFQKGRFPVKSWTHGVPFEDAAKTQLTNIASLPFIHRWVAAMPDVHVGKGATVGSVIPTRGAIIPAAVGVDLGCGMIAARTGLTASDLPDNLNAVRAAIEAAVPHGRSDEGGANDVGAWREIPADVADAWRGLVDRFQRICERHPRLERCNHVNHLGTLGTGNHFIEVCLDGEQRVWFMLHSGSRGVGGASATTSSPWRNARWSAGSSSCRTGIWRIWPRVASISTTTWKPWAGVRTTPG